MLFIISKISRISHRKVHLSPPKKQKSEEKINFQMKVLKKFKHLLTQKLTWTTKIDQIIFIENSEIVFIIYLMEKRLHVSERKESSDYRSLF
jgi:hypothetical protein